MNKSQVARIVAKVKPFAFLVLVTACGAAEPGDSQFTDAPDQVAPVAGSYPGSSDLPGSGGSGTAGATVATGGASAGSAGVVTSAGMGGASVASGGQPEATAGMSSGGAPVAGSGGMAQGGQVQGGGSAGAPATGLACPSLPPHDWKIYTVMPGHCLRAGSTTWSGEPQIYNETTPNDGKCSAVGSNHLNVKVGPFDAPITIAVLTLFGSVIQDTDGPGYADICASIPTGVRY